MDKESNITPMGRNQEQRRNVEKHNTGSRKRRYKGKIKEYAGEEKKILEEGTVYMKFRGRWATDLGDRRAGLRALRSATPLPLTI